MAGKVLTENIQTITSTYVISRHEDKFKENFLNYCKCRALSMNKQSCYQYNVWLFGKRGVGYTVRGGCTHGVR